MAPMNSPTIIKPITPKFGTRSAIPAFIGSICQCRQPPGAC